jgi:AraC-like DNA-binding protein
VLYEELAAPQPLDSIVHCFWFLSGDDLGSAPQTIVADGRLEIILHLANPFERIDAAGVGRQQPRALFSGQLTSPIQVRPSGASDIVGIRFRTAAANALFRAPLEELGNRVESLTELAPRLASELFDAASRAISAPARVNALSQVLTRFVIRTPDVLARSIVAALDVPHAPSVASVAALHNVSARTIERRVLANTGLTPSELRRVLRFRRAFRILEQSPSGTWAGRAAELGYYDQAHLIRDFRQFSGAAPSAFFVGESGIARAIMGSE